MLQLIVAPHLLKVLALDQAHLAAAVTRLKQHRLTLDGKIGGLGVQFSWGSFESRGERISEAVATAIEQMQDTRQSRRVNIAKAV